MQAGDQCASRRVDTPRVLLTGHLAAGGSGADGQIAKTRFVADELRRAFGSRQVRTIDTGGSLWRRARAQFELLYRLWHTDVLVAVPGERAVFWLLPQYCAWRRCLGTRVHVVAVGGWLSRLASAHDRTLRCLKQCDGIYVQSHRMVREFDALGVGNVHYMPNSRRFNAVRKPVLETAGPVRSVFISRIIPEKGVEVAVKAVLTANMERPGACTLDIFGPVPPKHAEWFRSLTSTFGDAIRYQGALPPAQVQAALRQYHVLLFPTIYPGEGFAGVLLDAMIAGLAMLVSDWLANAEVVQDGHNGFVLPPHDSSSFAAKLLELYSDRQLLLKLQRESAGSANLYHPDTIMPALLDQISRPTDRSGPSEA